MIDIKNERSLNLPSLGEIYASQLVAKFFLAKWKVILSGFSPDSTILVPVPRSAPIRKGYLWVPYEIAKAMEKEGFGTVKPILKRVNAVSRSSTSLPAQRPSPRDHYNSMAVEATDFSFQKILLVDDIVTRGHTFMGAAWRLKKAFPDAEIKAFAAMRTVSNEAQFKDYFDPVRGIIWYRKEKEDCLRRP